ncbi:MAG TPA: hypothetical protein PK967_17155, partial [Candidatus Hydrogenedentes bacterium]|nr:hypothetical protein [Candidatus Hydrogenedentota bacterium]
HHFLPTRNSLSVKPRRCARPLQRLACLKNRAPDFALAMLDGKESDGFTLRRLRRGIPIFWEEQHKQYAFPAPN